MVRLKEGDVGVSNVVYDGFNSTMVRLKAMLTFSVELSKLCFNSTMVRLKDAGIRALYRDSTKFQFHNGSIKSPSRSRCRILQTRFQFHNGSIKRIDLGGD